jgi:hypothetical protein
MEVEYFVERYPRLYHMAEKGTWPSIRAHGLLSTTAVLDLYGIEGEQRLGIEEAHRPEKMHIGPATTGIILRDQKPMLPSRLVDALIDGTTPTQWYKFLNGRVFMWAKEERLFGLLGARHYRNLEHDVLTVDTKSLMSEFSDKTWLCRMNSGNTWPVPHRRGMADFMRIQDYPTRRSSGAPLKEVVEVVVDYSIPNIAKFVIEVRRMKGKEMLENLRI